MLTSITNPRSLVLAVALSCFLSGAALAHGETPKAPPTHSPASKSFSQSSAHGKTPHSRRLAKVSHAHDFHGWSAHRYLPKYHCYGYYSPVKRLWFYWYAPFNSYLPLSYLAIYPPPNVGIVPTITGPGPADVASADQPTLPPGATAAPAQPPSDAPIGPDAKQAPQPQPMPMPNDE